MRAGNIERRDANSWRIKFEVGPRDPLTGKRRTKRETVQGSRRDAQRRLTQRLSEIDNGTFLDPTRRIVAEHLNQWLACLDHLAHKTRARYRALAEQQIIPHLGSIALQRLRPADLIGWHKTLLARGGQDGRPLSAPTVGHAQRVLHTALAAAVAGELLARNVASIVHPPGQGGRDRHPLL